MCSVEVELLGVKKIPKQFYFSIFFRGVPARQSLRELNQHGPILLDLFSHIRMNTDYIERQDELYYLNILKHIKTLGLLERRDDITAELLYQTYRLEGKFFRGAALKKSSILLWNGIPMESQCSQRYICSEENKKWLRSHRLLHSSTDRSIPRLSIFNQDDDTGGYSDLLSQ